MSAASCPTVEAAGSVFAAAESEAIRRSSKSTTKVGETTAAPSGQISSFAMLRARLDAGAHMPDLLPQQISPIIARASSLSCSGEGASTCHANATCAATSRGHCCRCSEGFIGNGRDCISKSKQATATFFCHINVCRHDASNHRLVCGCRERKGDSAVRAAHLHRHGRRPAAHGDRAHSAGTWLVAAAARQHRLCDVSGAFKPANESAHFRAWLFAKVESPDVQNGFQLTGE